MARWWRGLPATIRFVVRAALLMAAFCSVLYYPYAENSVPGQMFSRYLALVARASGGCLSLFDPQVQVAGTFITGRHALQIVLDCAALDALALFAATVLAFPAVVRVKLIGLGAGIFIISGFNLLRIVILYVAGTKSPEVFDFLHEDVMALLMVLVSVGCFAVWASRARNSPTRLAAHATSPV